MIGDRVIFIIPGYRQSAKNKAYCEIAKNLKSEGYFPVPVKIPWKNSTISDNVEYFLKVYKNIKTRKKYILGFSYGAMIAFIASTKIRTEGLILCSLSPYFKEDVLKTKKEVFSRLSEKRFNDFSKLHSKILAKRIKSKKVLMVYGGSEAKSLIRRVRETFVQIESEEKKLVRLKKAEHEIGSRKYLESILQAARGL